MIKYVALSNLSICYSWENIKESFKNNKFKISAPTWNDKFELPGGLYSVSDTENFLEYIVKKHETVTGNPQIRIPFTKIENRMSFKIKTVYYLEVLSLETMELLASTIYECVA